MPLIWRQERQTSGHPVYKLAPKRERINRAEVAGPVIPERLAVQLVAATLGHGVDHAAGGTAVFRGIIRCIDLKFLDGSFAGGVADARAAALFAEESLIVVGAIDGVVVEQAGDAAKAHEAETAIRHRARCAQRERGPAPAVYRQVVNRGVIDVGGEVRAIRGDNRKFGRGDDRLCQRLNAEGGIDAGNSANFDGDVGDLECAEAAAGDLERILTGLKMDEHVTATAI